MEEGVGERPRVDKETVPCPFCGRGLVEVTHESGYVSWNVSRISAGTKRTKYYHDPRTIVHSSCPECRASKQQIRQAIESGGKSKSHEERVERMKSAGLPTAIEERVDAEE